MVDVDVHAGYVAARLRLKDTLIWYRLLGYLEGRYVSKH